MTRKKFVKQLMAKGVKRNGAERFARHCCSHKISYNEGFYLWECLIGIMCDAITGAIENEILMGEGQHG